MTPKDFRALLELHGIGQSEFARLAGVESRQVRRWADTRSPHPLTMGAEARIRITLDQSKGMSSKVAP